MWRVDLRFGPLRVWTTRDQQAVAIVLNILKRQLLTVATARRLPAPVREWARAKQVEIERLMAWAREVDNE